MTAWTCAITGEDSEGKHYILKTTDSNDEFISPGALLGNSDEVTHQGRLLKRLQGRIERLEELFGDELEAKQPAPGPIAAAAAKAAAPVKKLPKPRGASD